MALSAVPVSGTRYNPNSIRTHLVTIKCDDCGRMLVTNRDAKSLFRLMHRLEAAHVGCSPVGLMGKAAS